MEDALNPSTSPEEDDLRRMLLARDGDLEAFACLYHRHRPRVETFLHRLSGSREKAEDGAQEVFLRLWTSRHRYEPRTRFTTFLYQIALNYWRDERRKAGARPSEVEIEGEEEIRPGQPLPPAPPAVEPQYQLLLRYQQWRIREAIARLPESYRVVFVLGHLEGHKMAEIAEILQIPVGTVKSRMHEAARRLREWLRSEDEEET